MTTETATTNKSHDWFPWAILAIVALALFGVVHFKQGDGPKLSERTAQTGHPLTPEQASVDFQTADLTFEVLPDKRAITGKAKLGFLVSKPISKLQFDLDPELPISAMTVDGKPIDKSAWANDDGIVTVTLPAPKQAGEKLALGVDYAGKPHVAKRAPWDGGFVWSTTKGGKPWIASAIQGEGCDMFWPCIDNSLVEIGQVDLHIIVPEGLSAPANGRLIGQQTLSDGRQQFDWRAHRPNNYAIAINVGPYQELKADYRSRYGNVIPLRYWYLPGEEKDAKALFAEFGPTLDFFETAVGPYPFGAEKVGVVETPHLGMEHQTINAYGNGYKPSPEGYDWLFNHEFSHEWFGNQLTNRDWDDMWLHEGFGSYMQPLYLRSRQGEIPYDAWLWKNRQLLLNKYPLVSGKHQLEHFVYDPATGPGLDIYYKGAWVLHTLRETIGDDAFFRSLKRIVYGRPDPAPGNFQPRFGTTDEYEKIVSEEAGRDMRWFFDVYVRKAALPRLLTVRQGNTLFLQWQTPGRRRFPMPVDVRIDGSTQTVAMANGRGSITIPSSNAVVTIDPTGKLLVQNDAIDKFRDYTAAQKGSAKK